jgi:beta-lactamase class A
MTTGLVSRLLAGAALATAVLASAAPAHADSLQSEFDKAFSPSAVSTRSPLQAPAKAPPLKVQPSTESAKRVLPATVRPFVSGIAPRPYGSGLEAQLAAQADPSLGRIGVAAINLSTGRTTTVLGDTPFPMASTSKIAIAATFLAGVDDGRFSLDASYPLMVPVKSKKYSTTVAPVRPGQMMTGRQLIERALIYSDNAATDALLAVVGGPTAVNRWMRSTGNTGMRIDRDIATLVRDDGEYNPATMIDERDSATPLAMARMLSGLYQGRWLSGDSRAFLISTMERCQTGKRRMRALLPSDARIAHKTGTLSNTASDVGLVRTSDGQVYAIAVYVTGQGGHAGRDAKIAAISRTIYDGYSGESSSYRVAAQ